VCENAILRYLAIDYVVPSLPRLQMGDDTM